MADPELREEGSSSSSSSSSTECLTISNFEDYLFDSSYNLSNLNILLLSSLTELRVIWNGPIRVENFQNLSELSIVRCNKLRYIFSPTMAQNLPQLSKLTIYECVGLEEIIEKGQTSSQDHPRPLICFPNLTQIDISKCGNLKCLFPITNIVHENLTKLKMIDLQEMSKLEQVFEGDEANVGTDEENRIHLPQLRDLKLKELPNLVRLSPVGYHFLCPSLITLKVEGCASITTSFNADSNKSVVAKTQIVGSRSIQQGYTHHLSFRSLKELELYDCNNLKYLFPMCVANSLGQLQKLRIERCDELEEIIQVEGVAINACNLQSLREVEVANCNKLKSLFSLSQAHNKLENLTKLSIENCLELEFIFPNLVPQGLPQLYHVFLSNLPRFKGMNGNEIVLTSPSIHKLKVENCPQLTPLIISAKIQELTLWGIKTEREQIGNMAVPELRGGGGSSSSSSSSTEYLTISNFEDLFDSSYNLSNLKKLELSFLTELQVIWNGLIRVENFQNLSELEFHKCIKLRYIFSPTMARNLPQLRKLRILGCAGLEEIIEKGQTSSQDHPQPLICFPNLTQIYISKCGNLKCLFPITVAHAGLPKLISIYLKVMSELEQVFEGDEANVGTDEENRIQLPQLKEISLLQLPNLTRLGPVGYHFVCPYLITLKVEGCANITTRFSVDSNKSVVARAQASQSSFDNNIVEESVTAQETTWPIGSDIRWGLESESESGSGSESESGSF